MSKKAPPFLAVLLLGGGLTVSVAKGQPIGAIESPSPGQTVSGVVSVVGFVLDFNRVQNPPCAYTAYATCPLPTRRR